MVQYSNVISLVDLLNRSHGDEISEEIQKYLKMIKESAYSLKEVIGELTEIAKIGT